MQLEVCAQIWNVVIILLDHNACSRKLVILSDQTGFLSGQTMSLAGQMTCLQACVCMSENCLHVSVIKSSQIVHYGIEKLPR